MKKRRDVDGQHSGTYASPPCYLHELDPAYGLPAPTWEPDQQEHVDVARWRKAERVRLIEARMALDFDCRHRLSQRISAFLEGLIGESQGLVLSAYWPIRGEPDLRALMTRVVEAGGRCALPVVRQRDSLLVFREWRPGARMELGVGRIPVPADGAEVVPDVMIAPVVGFDKACYRLGYGTGSFDRTLASMNTRPRLYGAGYAQAALATIFPQAHDVAMDRIVTEDGIHEP